MNEPKVYFPHTRHLIRRTRRWVRMLFNVLVVKPLHELGSPLIRFGVQLLQLIYFTLQDMGRNRTNIRTASLAFYTLLSIIPLLAVVFAAAKAMGYIDLLLENLYALFPQSPELIDYGVHFAEQTLARTRGGWMALVAGGMMIWSAIDLIDELVKAFNETWQIRERRSLGRYGIYLIVLIFFPAFWIGAEVLGRYLSSLFGLSEWWLFRILGSLTALLLELGVFILFYKVIPHTRVEWRSAAVAGVTAGLVFQIFQWFFTSILTSVTSYNAIYGSFAAIPLFLFWLRYSWQILLTGNELAYAYQNLHLLREERKSQ